MKYCKACQETYDDKFKFCPLCAGPLTEKPEAKRAPSKKVQLPSSGSNIETEATPKTTPKKRPSSAAAIDKEISVSESVKKAPPRKKILAAPLKMPPARKAVQAVSTPAVIVQPQRSAPPHRAPNAIGVSAIKAPDSDRCTIAMPLSASHAATVSTTFHVPPRRVVPSPTQYAPDRAFTAQQQRTPPARQRSLQYREGRDDTYYDDVKPADYGEQEEKKKMNKGKMVTAVVAGIVMLTILGIFVYMITKGA